MKKIPLTQGKFALVDDEDYEILLQFKWSAYKSRYTFYAHRNVWVGERRTTEHMHTFLMQPPMGLQVDHKDGNGLNNQRSNIRVCRQVDNMRNMRSRGGLSKHKGVGWHKGTSKWRACIGVGGKHVHLGLFFNEDEAARMYDQKAKELFGEFARLNFPEN